ncbi:unnamed protein product [Calypogeia fissa]
MMGSRAGIAERRLRPLWDAIDTRQYKTALKLASGLQAKHPDSSYILALKALVLERTGKSDEALLLCQQARDSGPVDELTLNTLQTVYNRLHLLHESTACYEFACSKITNNVELLMSLFKCYVRQYLYVKQQQTAMKLYKQVGEERFLLWSVCSVLLQVGSDDGSSSKLLALAEALLKKRVDSHSLHDREALMLYINVLQQQEKHEIALEVMSGKLGGLFSIQTEKLRLQGELLMSTRQYDKAAEFFEKILKISSDDWGVFLSYLDASLRGAEQNAGKSSDLSKVFSSISLEEDEVDKTLNRAMGLVQELQGMEVKELRRGPYLAVVEIEKRRLILKNKADSGKPMEKDSPLVTSILAYFERFGHLLSFSSDMSTFVEYIDENSKLPLATALHDASSKVLSSSPVKRLRFKVSAFQMEELLGVKLKLSDKDLISHAAEIVKLYLESLELSVDLDVQESMHGEELLMLVTNMLIEVFRRSQQLGYLLEAILVLEFGLYARRYSSQYKLVLINLYTMLSAVAPAFDWYRSLDMKFILLESMSHLILPGVLGSTRWSDLGSLLTDSLKFYDNHRTESADLTILAYQHSTYSKVLEFVNFKDRLERSHQHLIFRIEAAIMDIKLKADKLEEFEFGLVDLDFGKKTLEWSSEERLSLLSFNEDLQMRPWWSPAPDKSYLTGSLRNFGGERSWHHVETKDERISRENQWRLAARRRCLIPRILFLMLTAVKETGVVEQNRSSSIADLRSLQEEFLKTLGLQFDKIESWLSKTTSEEHLLDWLQEFGISPGELMTLTVFWASYQLTSNLSETSFGVASLTVQVMEKIIDELLKAITIDLTNKGEEKDTIEGVSPGSAIFDLVGLTSESVAWLGLYLLVWAKRLQPVPKKKKKGGGSLDQNDAPVSNHLLSCLEIIRIASISSLEKLNNYLTDHLSRPLEQEVNALLSLLRLSLDISGSPGTVLAALENGVAVASKLAARSSKTKQSWGTAFYVRSMVSSQRSALKGIHDICTMRLKVLKPLKF